MWWNVWKIGRQRCTPTHTPRYSSFSLLIYMYSMYLSDHLTLVYLGRRFGAFRSGPYSTDPTPQDPRNMRIAHTIRTKDLPWCTAYCSFSAALVSSTHLSHQTTRLRHPGWFLFSFSLSVDGAARGCAVYCQSELPPQTRSPRRLTEEFGTPPLNFPDRRLIAACNFTS